jgi:glucokinase
MEKKPFVIGLDLGGTNSAFGIVDRDANIVERVTVPTTGHGTVEQYVKDCVAALMPVIERVGGISQIQGMGVGAPNANYYTGEILQAPNLPWTGCIPLAKLFGDALGVPVAITNDANAAAMGEMAYGAAKGMKNFIEITLGTGVGSGIVVNGQVVYGCDGFAGELGHTIIVPGGRECGCGRKGCLETYCSGPGVARTALELMAQTREKSVLRDIASSKIMSKDVSIAANNGDALAIEALKITGRRLGEACANFMNFCSVEAFIFFGGPVRAGEPLMKHVREAFEENVLPIYKGKAQILLSNLKDSDAAILGASALAL